LAALRAARRNPVEPLVLTARLADACRALLPRRRDTRCACRERLFDDAAECPSRLSVPKMARERVLEGFGPCDVWAFRTSRRACTRVRADVPRFGGGNLTPARRAFESPMAIA